MRVHSCDRVPSWSTHPSVARGFHILKNLTQLGHSCMLSKQNCSKSSSYKMLSSLKTRRLAGMVRRQSKIIHRTAGIRQREGSNICHFNRLRIEIRTMIWVLALQDLFEPRSIPLEAHIRDPRTFQDSRFHIACQQPYQARDFTTLTILANFPLTWQDEPTFAPIRLPRIPSIRS